MIERTDGILVAYCDICGEDISLGYDFVEAREELKRQGWGRIKYRGEWQNICPECYNE